MACDIIRLELRKGALNYRMACTIRHQHDLLPYFVTRGVNGAFSMTGGNYLLKEATAKLARLNNPGNGTITILFSTICHEQIANISVIA